MDLLLEIWQKPRLIDTETGEPFPRLEDYLGVPREKLQKKLEKLALRFHREQGHKPGLADIKAGDFARSDVFQTPNHPQVGVCWFEAMAFCRWLTDGLRVQVRLPHEREWERAAAGDGQVARVYPWGGSREDRDEEVAIHANMSDTDIGHTSPVGFFPTGETPDGISDLSGNVWEWCANLYDPSEDRRSLRGGSWGSSRLSVRASFRCRLVPELRYGNRGFRVVSSPFFPSAGH